MGPEGVLPVERPWSHSVAKEPAEESEPGFLRPFHNIYHRARILLSPVLVDTRHRERRDLGDAMELVVP